MRERSWCGLARTGLVALALIGACDRLVHAQTADPAFSGGRASVPAEAPLVPGADVPSSAPATEPGPAPAEAAPNEDATPTISEPPPPLPEANAARLEEIDQTARIALRKTELLEEAANARAADGVNVTFDSKRGFVLKRTDGASSFHVGALLQVDGRFALRDDALQANDAFLLRRFRPLIDGTFFTLVDYRLVPEFAGTVQIMDAYVDIHPSTALRLRVGKFKGPVGLERLQSDPDVPLLERALDQNLSSQREVGVQLWGELGGGALLYALAIVDGAPDGANPDNDFNHAKDLAGRIFLQPFGPDAAQDYGTLGLGVAGTVGNRKGRLPSATAAAATGLPSFKTFGQNTFFQYFAPATDTTGATTTVAHELESHINPQLYYYYQGFGLLAEYVILKQGVQRGNSTANLTHNAAHATLSYAIGGKEGFLGVVPTAPFDRATRSPGAFEIALRWSWLKVDPAAFGDPNVAGSTQYADPTKSARSAEEWAGVLTWIPAVPVHLAVSFAQTSFKGGAGTATMLADRKTENVIIGRAQVNF